MWYFQVKELSFNIPKYLMLALRSRTWHDPSLLLIFIAIFFPLRFYNRVIGSLSIYRKLVDVTPFLNVS